MSNFLFCFFLVLISMQRLILSRLTKVMVSSMTPPKFPSSVLNRIPNPFVFWKLWVAVLGTKSTSWIVGDVCMTRLINDVVMIILVLRLQKKNWEKQNFSSSASSAGASSWSGRESRCSVVIVIVWRDNIIIIITRTTIIFISMVTTSHHSDDVVGDLCCNQSQSNTGCSTGRLLHYKSAGWWRPLRGRVPFSGKSARMSCRVVVVLHDHHLLGKGLASLHRKEVLIVDLQNIVNGKEQSLKGFEQWTSCQRQTRRVQPLQCIGAVTDIHFLFWSSGDSWECVSRSVTFWYG